MIPDRVYWVNIYQTLCTSNFIQTLLTSHIQKIKVSKQRNMSLKSNLSRCNINFLILFDSILLCSSFCLWIGRDKNRNENLWGRNSNISRKLHRMMVNSPVLLIKIYHTMRKWKGKRKQNHCKLNPKILDHRRIKDGKKIKDVMSYLFLCQLKYTWWEVCDHSIPKEDRRTSFAVLQFCSEENSSLDLPNAGVAVFMG